MNKYILSYIAPLFITATTAFGQSFYLLEKAQLNLQSSASSPGSFTNMPYLFSCTAPTAATLTPPGLTGAALAFNSTKSDYEINRTYATKAAMDTANPNGSYKLSGSGISTATVSMSSDLYPVTPQVTNGTWQNGVLVVDPTQSYTINLNNFASYATGGIGGYEDIKITSENGVDNITLEQTYCTVAGTGATVSSTPFTSYVIPAGKLTAGLPYRLVISYYSISNYDTTTIPGAGVVGMYENTVIVYVVAKSSTSIAPPVIGTQPVNQAVGAGSAAPFTPAVTFNGSTSVPANTSVFWYFINPQFGPGIVGGGTKYTPVSGYPCSIQVNSVATTDVGSYYLEVVNGGGVAITQDVSLSIVTSPPSITTQPAATQSINAGGTVTLTAAASGAGSYQWWLGGSAVAGATNATLSISNIGTTQEGNYTLVATNGLGSATSNAAKVSVSVNSYLYNISTYGYVGSGTGQDLDAGFFIYGSGSKNILVMGAGPNLANASNGGSAAFAGLALAAPGLTFDGVYPAPTSTLGTNTAWGGGATLTNAMKAVYAPVFVSTSNDTGITGSYPVSGSNGYTVDVTINSGGPGLSLVEVDDVDSFKALPTIAPSSYLANISTRGYVGASGGVSGGSGIAQYEYLDAGFTIFGTTSQTLLIRAVGPSLSGAPAATLAKPKLTLFDSSGSVIATNTGWGTAPVQGNSTVAAGIQPATTAIMNSVYASTITPGSADCAMVVTLPSGTSGQGAYTATVTSADNVSAGIALVEVYNLPP